MSDQDETLMALGAVEHAVSRLEERLARVEKLIEQIALGMGIKPS